MIILAIIIAIAVAIALTYAGRAWLAWVIGAGLCVVEWLAHGGGALAVIAAVLWLGIALSTGVPMIRRRVIAAPALRAIGPHLPRMSETEQVALEAGTTWWDAALFSGAPDLRAMTAFAPRPLSPEERAFLDGPCAELCRMLDDHEIRATGDLPPAVWSFLKRERFMGMIIPREYNGLGFSAIAHSQVVAMLASRSGAACVTVMVPNSLGPAELLLRYGTDEQKRFYLPRLAVGAEVPCFALTEPHAGSDAAGLRSRGVVCKGRWRGREVTGIRLTWDKRYITLAPVATVLGLAFHLHDPDHLLGDADDLGITCALIPVSTPGVWIGHRHDPMSVPFQNGPTRGDDVFVPLDHVIGGAERVGQGWRMLMESLSAGRSLSLPADAVGSAQLATRVIGAYATVREQFGLPIGRFEGVLAAVGRIAGTTYWMNAVREVTCGAVDAGERPGVISSIAKCWSTEALRRVANDAMDVAGGYGICKGPHNTLAAVYEGAPIGITVEGANILTRSLIVFGQGAMRCHPFARAELAAADAHDLAAFDRALAGHVSHVARNATRAFVHAFTGGHLAAVPDGAVAPAARALARLSSVFALTTDALMATLGGALKRAEGLAGRMADALAWMYVASATINRRAADPDPGDDALYAWASAEALWQVEHALRGVIDNLPSRAAAFALRVCAFPRGTRHRPPSDAVTAAAGRAILDGHAGRVRLTRDMFVPGKDEIGLGRLERALELAVLAAPLRKKLHDGAELTADERTRLHDADDACEESIRVDSFAPRRAAAAVAR